MITAAIKTQNLDHLGSILAYRVQVFATEESSGTFSKQSHEAVGDKGRRETVNVKRKQEYMRAGVRVD
jgi:hypothetical protein